MSGVFRKVLPYLRPYLATFAFCLLLVLALTAFELVKPWPLQIVVDLAHDLIHGIVVVL